MRRTVAEFLCRQLLVNIGFLLAILHGLYLSPGRTSVVADGHPYPVRYGPIGTALSALVWSMPLPYARANAKARTAGASAIKVPPPRTGAFSRPQSTHVLSPTT